MKGKSKHKQNTQTEKPKNGSKNRERLRKPRSLRRVACNILGLIVARQLPNYEKITFGNLDLLLNKLDKLYNGMKSFHEFIFSQGAR